MKVLNRKTGRNLYYLQIASTIILLLLANSSKSQSLVSNTNISKISLDYSYGRLADNRRMYKSLISGPSQSVSLSLYSTPRENNIWYRPNTHTLDGTAFYFINLSNNPHLGNLFGVSRFMEFHLLGTQHFGLSIRSEMGGAYVSETFHPTENYKNILISKHFNFLYGFALQSSYQPSSLKGLGLKAGISLLHVSNGETKIPNQGINNISYTAGIFYRPINQEVSRKLAENPLEKRWDLSVYPTIGWKEYWRYGGPKYLAFSFSSELLYSVNKKFMLGAGLDLFYDETQMIYSNHNKHPVSSAGGAIDGEIHLTALLNIARVQLLLRTGTPLYSGGDRYGKIHNTFGIKYNVSDRFFLVVYHKSHALFYGDNVQWGFGYSIIKGHRNYE